MWNIWYSDDNHYLSGELLWVKTNIERDNNNMEVWTDFCKGYYFIRLIIIICEVMFIGFLA